jgi:hypothetical protein
MFQALLAQSQEALHKRHLVYCNFTASVLQPTDIIYVTSIPNSVCVAPPADEQVMLETCRGP